MRNKPTGKENNSTTMYFLYQECVYKHKERGDLISVVQEICNDVSDGNLIRKRLYFKDGSDEIYAIKDSELNEQYERMEEGHGD